MGMHTTEVLLHLIPDARGGGALSKVMEMISHLLESQMFEGLC